jgi:hypothetical protein
VKPEMLFVPQPDSCPHETSTRKIPSSTIEPSTPRGMLRRGSSLSSASGAAASHPVMAKIANTIARKKSCELGALPGFSHEKLVPPLPGSNRPQRASAVQTAISNSPRTMMRLVESSIPRNDVYATTPIRNTMNTHQGKFHPYSASSVPWSVSPMKEPTWATTTG